MGYYSNVVLAIPKDIIATEIIKETLPPLLKNYEKTETDQQIHEDIQNPRNKGDEIIRYYSFASLKWYDHYKERREIREFNDWLLTLNDEDYGFIRTGEELEDVEYQGSPQNYDIFVQNYISTGVGELPE